MSTTNLEAVNELLRGSNEVPLTSANFSSAVGVQAYAKDIINRAYLEICAEEEEWPFLAAAASNVNEPYSGNTTLETADGVRWYLLKTGSTGVTTDFTKIDWDSFTLTTEGATGRTAPYLHNKLDYITHKHWLDRYSQQEEQDAGGESVNGIPKRVVASPDGRYFGLSPIPDGIYKVYFTSWVQPTRLTTYSEALLIPDRYVPVLLHRARYYFYMFKKDYQEAALADRAYKEGLRSMRRHLIGRQSDYMRDDRITR